MGILLFLVMFFMAQAGCIYTIAADIYAFCLALNSILYCILHQNTLHFAPKRTAFSGILHCI